MRTRMDKFLYIALGTFAVIFLFAMQSEAGGKFTMEMKRYRNPHHLKYSGRCCDFLFFRCGKCDTYFRICVTQDNIPWSYSHSRCSVLRQEYGRHRHFHDSFSMDYGVTRPLQSLRQKTRINILVESWDKDRISKDDLIDKFRYKLSAVPSPKTKYVTLSGRRASLLLSFKVSCDTHYYGSNCEVYCRPRRDNSGHFMCNNKGGKVCLPGWYGDSCTRYCLASSSDQYTCDHHGNKICHKGWNGIECDACARGWHGPRCSKFCLPMNRRYTCDREGNRLCLRGWSTPLCMTCAPGWFGRHCFVRCVSVKGRYSCDRNGKKICQRLNGWYGFHCSKRCLPVKGKYRCDNLGNRMCLEGWAAPNCTECARGWYGPKCDVNCQPISNRYSCHNDGKKVCMGVWTGPECKTCAKGWFGLSCNKYCMPSNSNKTGFYYCDKDGKKICNIFWHGSDCLTYCKPSDDDINGHYTCNHNGKKICKVGFHGPNCRLLLFGKPS